MEVLIPLLDIVINSALTAIYFVIAYLFYQGLMYAKQDGQLMLKGVAVFFFMASVHSIVNVFLAVDRIYNNLYINPYLTYDYLAVTFTEIMLAAAALYLLYATIKRNPPQEEHLNGFKNKKTEVTKKW